MQEKRNTGMLFAAENYWTLKPQSILWKYERISHAKKTTRSTLWLASSFGDDDQKFDGINWEYLQTTTLTMAYN